MTSHATVGIASHRFDFGYYRQAWWNWLIGAAFFFGEIGAGLFLVSLLTGYWPGLVAGYLIVMVGKNMAHLMYLGRPLRFWRAALRPDRSWIARGAWATGLFALSGLIILLPHLVGSEWTLNGWAGSTAHAVALLSSLFIMFYDGFVMNFSPSVAFWHSNLLPLLCFTYAALGGTTVSLTLRELGGTLNNDREMLLRVEYALLAVNLVLLAVYMKRMSTWTASARETVRLLLKGTYARAFLGLVVSMGLLATLVLSIAHSQIHAVWLVLLIAACELTGDFALLMVLLRSGLFAPQTAPAHAKLLPQ
ncbi:MAG: NrfD/PsrC family molybdoenzyme membrane anchor subunit [Acidobacteriota bacterium]